MADVEIKYNNATIASLSDSGTEVLETNSTYLTDDITVEYTKSGGGGGGTVDSYFNGLGTVYYTDSTGTVQNTSAFGEMSVNAMLNSIIMVVCDSNPASAVSNCTKITDISMGARANYKYVTILQATEN